MTDTTYIRPLTTLERRAVEPEQLAKVLDEAYRRLACRNETNVADVRSTLHLTAGRLRSLGR